MLNSLRTVIDSWFSKLLLGILVLCFAVLWGAPQLTQHQGNGVLKSGDTVLTLNDALLIDGDFRFRTSLVTNGLQRLLSTSEANEIRPAVFAQMPVADFLPLGIRMRNDVVLKETARQLKLGASKEVIRREIGNDPFFRNNSNGFERRTFDIYENVLQSTYANYVSAKDIINQYAFDAKREQLLAAISGNAKLPDTFFKALSIYQNETRTIDFIQLTPTVVGALSISNADLEKWFEANKNRYIAPEYREVIFIALTPDIMKKTDNVSDNDIKAFYERNITQFSRQDDMRRLSVLHFASTKDANAAGERLNKGLSFDALAKELAKKPVSDDFAKADLPSAIADSLFALPENGVSGVVNMVGPAIIRIDAILPKGPKPLEAVAATIRDEIARRNASTALNKTYEAIESDWFDGVSLTEISQKFGLALKTVTFDEQGKAMDGTAVNNLPQQQQLIQASFQTDVDVNQAPLPISQGGYVWYQVNKIIEPRNKNFTEVRDAALQDWKAEETVNRLTEKAKTIKQELDNGKTIDQVAAAMHLEKKTQTGLQRAKEVDGFSQVDLQMIFSGAKGFSGIINGTTEAERIIFLVADVTKPTGATLQSVSAPVRETANAGLRYDINNAVIQERLEQQKTSVLNQAQFQQLTGGGGDE